MGSIHAFSGRANQSVGAKQRRLFLWIFHVDIACNFFVMSWLWNGSLATRPENIVLVGHSSGAQAALRYTELYPVRATVLVSATYSDLGDAHERASGYYPQASGHGTESNPYLFQAMKDNCPTWRQFHSDDDPFIPLHEAERIRDGLELSAESGEYRMLPGRSHFFEFAPEILQAIVAVCWAAIWCNTLLR